MILRDPGSASRRAFDVIIIGGGVYGICLALEAARRGIRALLLEQSDFGGATSWNSLRIVHGGLRYLQSCDLRRCRESIQERSWFLREFSDLVAPLRCLMPLYGRGLRRRSVLGLALQVNNLVSSGCNAGLAADRKLPRARLQNAQATLQEFSWSERAGLKGAAVWYDAWMWNPPRLLIELLSWAVHCGAQALNYCAAEELLQDGGCVAGVVARDVVDGRKYEFRAPRVVNCAGPWSRQVARTVGGCGDAQFFAHSLAFNLLIDREPPGTSAAAVSSRRAKNGTFFLLPWKRKALVGTFHVALPANHDVVDVSEELLVDGLQQLNACLPAAGFRLADIARVHWGLLPAVRIGSTRLARRQKCVDHGARGGMRGFFSVEGVKFTTARRTAEEVICRIHPRARYLEGTQRPSPARYMNVEEFESLITSKPEEAEKYARDVAARESVQSIEDLLLRRTDWGFDPLTAERLGAKLQAFFPEFSAHRRCHRPDSP